MKTNFGLLKTGFTVVVNCPSTVSDTYIWFELRNIFCRDRNRLSKMADQIPHARYNQLCIFFHRITSYSPFTNMVNLVDTCVIL